MYFTQPLFFRLLPKLDVVEFESHRPLFRTLEVPIGCSRRGPNGSRRFFLGTRWRVDFRRQEDLLLGCERGEQRVEIEGRLRPVGRWLRAEPELAPDLRRLRTELVRLPVLVDRLAGLGVLPPTEAVLDAVTRRCRFGKVRGDRSQPVPTAAFHNGPPSRSPRAL